VRPNTSTSPKAANANAAAWEGRDLLPNIYLNKSPKGRNNRASRSDAIAIFVIFDPPARRVESQTE
jgi:hypothetical protein